MDGKNVILTLSLLMISIGFVGGVEAQLVQRGAPEISVDGNDVDVKLRLYNPDTLPQTMLVELQLRDKHWPLAVIGSQQVCNPNYPWNVHRIVTLYSGENADFTLTSTRDDGTYHLYLVSVDKCCVNQVGETVYPACVDKSPYGLYGLYIGDVKFGDNGGQVIPPSPYQFIIDFFVNYWYIIVIAVVLIVAGVILWKTDKGGRK